MIDLDDNQLEIAKAFGATHTINTSKKNAIEKIKSLTHGKGVDTVIEAVAVTTFELCEAIAAPGGQLANIGVHGKPVTLHLETLWSKNITITTWLVDTVTTPMLLKTVQSKKIDPKQLITHHFKLDQVLEAYETFEKAAKEKTLKVMLTSE